MLRKRKQYGGQTNEDLQELQQRVEALRAELEKRRAEAEQASKNFNAASTLLRNVTSEKARVNENAKIKIQASQNANAEQAKRQAAFEEAEKAKTLANTQYNTALKNQKEFQDKYEQAKKSFNNATTVELNAVAKQESSQIELAKVQSVAEAISSNVNAAQKLVTEKEAGLQRIELDEAKRYDPSVVEGLRAWFDASQLPGANQTSITTWESPSTFNTIPSVAPSNIIPRLTGQATIGLWNSMKIVSLNTTQSLSLTDFSLPQFTLFIVCRHSGTNRNSIFRGKDQSKTIYGYTTGKKNYFSIGNSENTSTTINADTNWDVLSFYRDTNSKAGFYRNGSLIVEYPTTTAGFDGLSVNTGTSKSDVEIAEIVLFGKGLTLDEIQKIEGLLSRKWSLLPSIPDAHPYKKKFPDLLGVLSGGRKKQKRRLRKLKKTRKARKGRKRTTHRR